MLVGCGQPAGGALVRGGQMGLAKAQWSRSMSSTQGQTPRSLAHVSAPKAELSGQPAKLQSEGEF